MQNHSQRTNFSNKKILILARTHLRTFGSLRQFSMHGSSDQSVIGKSSVPFPMTAKPWFLRQNYVVFGRFERLQGA